MDPKAVVRDGYDRISEAYRADAFDPEGTWYATACVSSAGSWPRALGSSTWAVAAASRSLGPSRSGTGSPASTFALVGEWFIPEGDGGHRAFLARREVADGVGGHG